MSGYIDRDLALSLPWANGEYDHEHANENFIIGLKTYKEWLEYLPTADVTEVKHSHYYGEELPCLYLTQVCGACGLRVPKECYCQHCGAKMDGGSE